MSYFKKSHSHKPAKGKGSYTRTKEYDMDEIDLNTYRMNVDYARERELSEQDIDLIQQIGNRLEQVCQRPELYGEPADVVQLVDSLEVTLQHLWGFPFDEKFLRYQMEISGCTCPKMDNRERVGGTGARVVSMNCPFHGLGE